MHMHLLTWRGSRALQWTVVAFSAIAAYVLMSATSAHAQVEISNTNIEISNSGSADADTGSNETVANDSVNSTSNVQSTEPEAEISNNVSDESNDSDGTATVSTGSATATGNASGTVVLQSSGTGSTALAAAAGTPAGPTATSPLVLSDEAQPTGASSEGDGSTGSAADTVETEDEAPDSSEPTTQATFGDQAATAPVAAGATPASSLLPSGPGAADVGAPAALALATSPLDNTVMGAVSGAGPPGFSLTTQSTEVENLGEAEASTGDNVVTDGDVLTGDAKATGNTSATTVVQAAAGLGDLNLIEQDTDVDNEGDADADTGDNLVDGGDVVTGDATALGNSSETTTAQTAETAGDLNQVDQETEVSNDGDADASTGDNEVSGGSVETGSADATGNSSDTTTSQLIVATGDLNLIDQATEVSNEGEAEASTGDNEVEDGDIATGDATAIGNWSGTTIDQQVVTEPDEALSDVQQELVADNLGDAEATTGDNSAVAGDDGEVTILTGNALAIGNEAFVAGRQEA
jgi:hypothetical protein